MSCDALNVTRHEDDPQSKDKISNDYSTVYSYLSALIICALNRINHSKCIVSLDHGYYSIRVCIGDSTVLSIP